MSEINKYHEKMITNEDKMTIYPFDGKRKVRVLNRTQIEFKCDRNIVSRYEPCTIQLRSSQNAGHFKLGVRRIEGKDIFEFKSTSDRPFSHNGNFSYSCLLRRGDIIDFGHNRLVFEKDQKSNEKRLPLKYWPKDSFLCLEGETGTGKSVLAKQMHNEFVGEQAPFVAINLSAFSESLIESELFGHEKGAFTGALRERRGAVELAKDGTLFIDEVDSLPIHLQVKLLQFLDDKTYRRVGGERLLRTNCRIIFASGRPLRKLTDLKSFRSDLYFRISGGLSLRLKPLREDRQRLKRLIENFAQENSITFSKELVDFLEKCPWPGNLRQLDSHLCRKKILSNGQSLIHLNQEDHALLSWESSSDFSSEDFKSLDDLKREHCLKVFLASSGHYEKASERLGIAVSTLRRTLAA